MFTKTLTHMAMLSAVVATPLDTPMSSRTELQRPSGSVILETPLTNNVTSSLRVQAPSDDPFPVTIYVPDDDPNKDEHVAKIQEAFADATMLAAVMHASLWEDEDIFQRYFEVENAEFVCVCKTGARLS